MLKGIDNRLNAEVLGALRAMGHGDYLVLVDTNFPADSIARDSVTAVATVSGAGLPLPRPRSVDQAWTRYWPAAPPRLP